MTRRRVEADLRKALLINEDGDVGGEVGWVGNREAELDGRGVWLLSSGKQHGASNIETTCQFHYLMT